MHIRDLPTLDIDILLVHCDISSIAKHRSDLLKRKAVGIRKEEPNDACTDRAGNNEDEVELPADSDESCGRGLKPYNIGEGDCRNA
jgi:hypothetical protein